MLSFIPLSFCRLCANESTVWNSYCFSFCNSAHTFRVDSAILDKAYTSSTSSTFQIFDVQDTDYLKQDPRCPHFLRLRGFRPKSTFPPWRVYQYYLSVFRFYSEFVRTRKLCSNDSFVVLPIYSTGSLVVAFFCHSAPSSPYSESDYQ